MRRLAQIASVLLTLPFVLSGYAEAAEPTVINLSCDGTLTGTYGTDKPKSMEASQKISVVVDLDDQTVFFLGYVVPIYDVDQASINFGGRQAVDYGFSIIIRGHIDRASGRMELTTVTTKPDDPNIATSGMTWVARRPTASSDRHLTRASTHKRLMSAFGGKADIAI